jgi:hypothetical protein
MAFWRLPGLPGRRPSDAFSRKVIGWALMHQAGSGLTCSERHLHLEALEIAIADALAAITIDNAKAWFAHCGYGLR